MTKKRTRVNLQKMRVKAECIKDNFALESSSKKTISQPIAITNTHPIYIGKFNLQRSNSLCIGSFTNDEEEIHGSLNVLNPHDELDYLKRRLG